jgi:RNA polymerase sigma-70 factor (family 1)
MEHSGNIRNFLYYKSGNLALAEDLIQEAFLKLWENCKKVPLSKAKSYLFTVANNLFLNHIHHQKIVLKFEQDKNLNQDEQSPEFLMEEQEFRLRLEKAIGDLPEEQRCVFLLNRIDKKKYREIAEDMNISIKTVEKRMHNALKVLRKIHEQV